MCHRVPAALRFAFYRLGAGAESGVEAVCCYLLITYHETLLEWRPAPLAPGLNAILIEDEIGHKSQPKSYYTPNSLRIRKKVLAMVGERDLSTRHDSLRVSERC